MPAELMRMSILPNFSTAAATVAATWLGSVTSHAAVAHGRSYSLAINARACRFAPHRGRR